jgi:hypothetical protein
MNDNPQIDPGYLISVSVPILCGLLASGAYVGKPKLAIDDAIRMARELIEQVAADYEVAANSSFTDSPRHEA